VVESFSALAVWLVPVLFLAGLILGAVLLGTPANLATTYGQLLMAKVAAFAVLMVLAALNKWRLGPALAAGTPGAGIAFRRSVLAEIALVTAVLGVTAVLTTLYSPEMS
jgi:putative copper resistance protein D